MSKRGAVVAISRSLGAGGEEAGRLAAQELGFRYADEEIIARAAESAGVSPEEILRAEETPGLLARVMEAMARHTVATVGWVGQPAVLAAEGAGYEELIRRVVLETAAAGNVVIVAHGASFPLAGRDGLLRVLVTASPEIRARRVAAGSGVDEAKAQRLVRESDRQRRGVL